MGGYLGFLLVCSWCFFTRALWDAGARWRLLLQHAGGPGSRFFVVVSFAGFLVPDFYGGGCDGFLWLPGGEGYSSCCQGNTGCRPLIAN